MAILAVEAAFRIGEERALSSAQRFVLMAYAFHANAQDGIAWAKRSTVARETGLSERTVIDAVSELVQVKLMVVHAYPNGGRGKSTEYRILPGEWATDQQQLELEKGATGSRV